MFDAQPYLDRVEASMKSARDDIESAIAATPTSNRRDALTEANMYLMMAQQKLEEANRL